MRFFIENSAAHGHQTEGRANERILKKIHHEEAVAATATIIPKIKVEDSVGDETVETTFEVRQGHGGHVNCV